MAAVVGWRRPARSNQACQAKRAAAPPSLTTMDNITHSLAGSLTAELALLALPERARNAARFPLHLTAIVANNLPDLDFVYTFITPDRLGYLLHHRGHTHTLGLAVLLTLASGWLLWPFVARRVPDPPPILRPLVLGLSCVGGLLHIAMDWGNSYGVHPFWPLSGRWYYGDALFIVEPLLIVSISATLLHRVQSRAMRVVNGLLCGLFCILPWFFPLPLSSRVLIVVVAALFLFGGRRRPRWQLPALLLWVSVVYGFGFSGSQRAHALVAQAVHREMPQYELLDVVRTPAPATPYCWEIIAIAVQSDEYLLRTGVASVWPAFSPEACPQRRSQPGTAPLRPVAAGPHPQLTWNWEWRGSRRRFAELAAACWSGAFLRFSRAPFWIDERRVLGDLRYDRSEGLDFAEMQLPEAAPCPRFIPGWQQVRHDVLPSAD